MKLHLALMVAFVAALATAARADDVGVIVQFHGTMDETLFAQHGGKATVRLHSSNAIAGRVPVEKLRALRLSPNVASVEEDVILHASLAPNDPRYASNQTPAFALINAPQAWDLSKGAGIRVCVLDTGVRSDHEDLGAGSSGKVKLGKNFTTTTTTDFADRNGHGTHTSGTVGAQTNNGIGVSGAGFDCELAMGKVLDDNGSGSTSWIAAGIDWAVSTSGSKIISMSFGGGGTTALRNSVNAAWNNGILLVAAAGNSNSSTVEFPAGYPNVMSVASTDAQGVRSSFSTYGSTVDIAAPGSSITSTWATSTTSYSTLSGTSMATPHVAGVAALLWAHVPDASNALVRLRLETSPTKKVAMPDGGQIPLLDALAALNSTATLPEVTVTATDPDASEDATEPGVFTIRRSGSTTGDLVITFTVSGSAASGTDYASLGTSVTIPSGAASATVTLQPVDDGIIEGSETVILTLAAGISYSVGTPKTATVTIHDNDFPPVVTVAATTAGAAEEGLAPGTFTFTRTGSDTSASLTVKFAVSGTATSGTDYASIGTSVTIPAGSASATKTVTPIEDTDVEGDETVLVTLVADAGYDIGAASSATVTIAENDVPPPPPPSTGGGGGGGGCGLLGLEVLILLAWRRRR
ncbi:MAG TPA: S8 family serine peptidase [Planctomycetota bacterium]|nr:S8 family serine peptidase [Planctomycetota bacterium]